HRSRSSVGLPTHCHAASFRRQGSGMAAVATTLLLVARESRHGWKPAERPERPVLVVNPASGDGRADRAALVDEARKRAIAVKVIQPGQLLAALVEEAVADGADALGIA